MKVSQVKLLLAGYSDDDELMIAWNDRESFEFVLDRPLPLEIWEKAVQRVDYHDMQEFNDYCYDEVKLAKDQLEKESKR